MNSNRTRSTIIYVLFFLAIMALVLIQFRQSSSSQETLSINQVAADIQAGKITRIVEDENSLTVIYPDGENEIEKTSHKEAEATFVEQLRNLGVTSEQLAPDKIKIEVKPPSQWISVATFLTYVLPFLIVAGILWFVFRQAQGSPQARLSLGFARLCQFGHQRSIFRI